MIQNSEVCNFADGNSINSIEDCIGTNFRLLKGHIKDALEMVQIRPNFSKSRQFSGERYWP